MKILYIYRDYKERRKDYGTIMEKCGHEIKYLEIKEKKIKDQVKIKYIKKCNPDIIWILTPYYISHEVISNETVDYLKTKKIPIVLYSTIDPEVPYIKGIEFWNKIDFLFIHYKKMAEFFREKGLNSYYMPLGFYPEQYYKTISKKKYNISFMGNALTYLPINKDKRSSYIQSLKKFDILVYGISFKERLNGIKVYSYEGNVRIKNEGHRIQREIYSKTKINLDLPFVNYKHDFYRDKYHIKNRFFEIPATCNFLLTVRCPEFLEIFDEDTVGYYDDNIESLREEVSRYLKDKKLREKMSEKAYKLVHEKHTFLHRFKEMFKIMENS